jgi:hypothetical protein
MSRVFSASRVAALVGRSRETISRHIRFTGKLKPDFECDGKYFFLPDRVTEVKKILDANCTQHP